MSRSIFGGRGGRADGEPEWPQQQPAARPPVPVPESLKAADQAPDRELVERIAAFRGEVADSLYAISKDYQILCNLTHADLSACDEIIDELRRRLAGNVHYAVLAKLDEAHALAEAHLTGKGR